MKAGLFGGGWEDYLDALNDAFDRHVAMNAPPHPFGASVEAILSGYPDAGVASDLPLNNPANGSETIQAATTDIPLQRGVYPPSPDVSQMLQCMQRECPGAVTALSSTSEPYKAHGPTNPHTRGLAADVKTGDGPTTMQCAADCGAAFQLDEYLHPSPGSNGGHVHLQLVPGLGGATGPYSNFGAIRPVPRPDN
jgi:hypothetical protein